MDLQRCSPVPPSLGLGTEATDGASAEAVDGSETGCGTALRPRLWKASAEASGQEQLYEATITMFQYVSPALGPRLWTASGLGQEQRSPALGLQAAGGKSQTDRAQATGSETGCWTLDAGGRRG